MSEIIMFSWSDRARFISELRAAGGSSNVSGVVDGDQPTLHLGRYARQYSVQLDERPTSADETGRTATFHCESGARYYLLVGAPWTNEVDYEAAYSVLIEAGATPNDLTDTERAHAMAFREWPKPPTMSEVAAKERQEVADGAAGSGAELGRS
jgi:hypothetical protein